MPTARLVEVTGVVSQEATYLFDFTIIYYLTASPSEMKSHTFVGLPSDDFADELAAWAQLEGFTFL